MKLSATKWGGGLILETGDETRILEGLSSEALSTLHVRRLGHVLTVGTADPALCEGLIHVHSPRDDHYEALVAEAGPDGVVHHPV